MVQRPGQGGFDFGGESPHIERLFIGLMVPHEAAIAASTVLEDARARTRLRGSAIRTDRMHVTLIHVGDYRGSLPRNLVADVKSAMESLSEVAFHVAFDRAGSFAGGPDNHPYVLLGGKGVEAVKVFRDRLFKALLRAGVRTLSQEAFNPHVTLTYGDQRLPERAVDPVSWLAADVLLIHSELGRTKYNVLGRWPLTSQAGAAIP